MIWHLVVMEGTLIGVYGAALLDDAHKSAARHGNGAQVITRNTAKRPHVGMRLSSVRKIRKACPVCEDSACETKSVKCGT